MPKMATIIEDCEDSGEERSSVEEPKRKFKVTCVYSSECKEEFDKIRDYRRHDNSQHCYQETWVCDMKDYKGNTCAVVFYDPKRYELHLLSEHGEIYSNNTIYIERHRTGASDYERFWCG